jgi:hypothetical protein
VPYLEERQMKPVRKLISPILSSKNTPVVLVVTSCAGVIVTAIMVHNAALKADEILSEYRIGLGPDEDLPLKDVVKYTWKAYAPAIGVGIITIASIITMNRINERNVAILTAGATLATTTLKEYQRHILDEIGSERESKVRDRIAKGRLRESPEIDSATYDMLISGDEVLCLDSFSGRYFKTEVEKIRKVENDLNHELLSTMFMSLNTLYFSLGLPSIDVGEVLGFNTDNMISFHYSPQLTEQKKPVLVITHINPPVPNFHLNYS